MGGKKPKKQRLYANTLNMFYLAPHPEILSDLQHVGKKASNMPSEFSDHFFFCQILQCRWAVGSDWSFGKVSLSCPQFFRGYISQGADDSTLWRRAALRRIVDQSTFRYTAWEGTTHSLQTISTLEVLWPCRLLGKDHLPVRLPVWVLEHVITKTTALGDENSSLGSYSTAATGTS